MAAPIINHDGRIVVVRSVVVGQGIEGSKGEGFFQAHVNASFYTSSFVSTMGFLRVSGCAVRYKK
jgi:hypothetical protein